MRLPRLENVYWDTFDAPTITKKKKKKKKEEEKKKNNCKNKTGSGVRNIG
jgi:hypothetical protein